MSPPLRGSFTLEGIPGPTKWILGLDLEYHSALSVMLVSLMFQLMIITLTSIKH